jgi:hypothetical protein
LTKISQIALGQDIYQDFTPQQLERGMGKGESKQTLLVFQNGAKGLMDRMWQYCCDQIMVHWPEQQTGLDSLITERKAELLNGTRRYTCQPTLKFVG